MEQHELISRQAFPFGECIAHNGRCNLSWAQPSKQYHTEPDPNLLCTLRALILQMFVWGTELPNDKVPAPWGVQCTVQIWHLALYLCTAILQGDPLAV